MSVHYKQPILLIEFEENKAFSLEVCLQCALNANTLHVHIDSGGDSQVIRKALGQVSCTR